MTLMDTRNYVGNDNAKQKGHILGNNNQKQMLDHKVVQRAAKSNTQYSKRFTRIKQHSSVLLS